MRFIFILLILQSCAGYKYRSKENPFMQFGVRSISVPMFYNHSNFPNVEGPFTREIYNTMIEYKGLKLSSGTESADAVLIGVIESKDKKQDTLRVEDTVSTESAFEEDIFAGNREDFLIPTQLRTSMRLRIIVIKQPTKEEIIFLSSKMGKNAISSKVIFNEVIPLNDSFLLKKFTNESATVIGTQNRGVARNSVQDLAKKAASSFKDMILYAF